MAGQRVHHCLGGITPVSFLQIQQRVTAPVYLLLILADTQSLHLLLEFTTILSRSSHCSHLLQVESLPPFISSHRLQALPSARDLNQHFFRKALCLSCHTLFCQSFLPNGRTHQFPAYSRRAKVDLSGCTVKHSKVLSETRLLLLQLLHSQRAKAVALPFLSYDFPSHTTVNLPFFL